MKMLKRSELTACIDDPVCEECQDADCKNCRRYYAPAHNRSEMELVDGEENSVKLYDGQPANI